METKFHYEAPDRNHSKHLECYITVFSTKDESRTACVAKVHILLVSKSAVLGVKEGQ